MAKPITSIHKYEPTKEESQQQKLEELQALLAEQEEAMNKILEITGELNNAGVLDAVQAMVKAKDDIAGIAVNQLSGDPAKNMIKNVLNASGILASIDPEVSGKLAESMKSGLQEAQLSSGNSQQIGLFDLMKSLKDPDINRAINYGLHFLKGMGKSLDEN